MTGTATWSTGEWSTTGLAAAIALHAGAAALLAALSASPRLPSETPEIAATLIEPPRPVPAAPQTEPVPVPAPAPAAAPAPAVAKPVAPPARPAARAAAPARSQPPAPVPQPIQPLAPVIAADGPRAEQPRAQDHIDEQPRRQPEQVPEPSSQPEAARPSDAAPAHVEPVPADAGAPSVASAAASAAARGTQAASQTEPSFSADYLNNPAPVYPPLARRMGEQGKVLLRVFVEPDGLPGEVLVRTSSGSARLDQAAVDTVRRWKFVGARRGVEPIGAWVVVPINFTLGAG